MKVSVVGLEKKLVENRLKEFELKLVRKNPDLVIAIGGDGTTLYAERIFPGIPKAMIRHENKKFQEKKILEVLSALKEKKYEIKEEIKVEGIVNNNKKNKLIGLNEINIHHQNPTKSIRLKVEVNGKVIAEEMIGDGIIIATPYGSTAYFYSISRKKFSEGLGIAFNNPKRGRKSFFVDQDSKIKVTVLRGHGFMAADNNEKMIPIKKGDTILVKKSKEKARLIKLKKV